MESFIFLRIGDHYNELPSKKGWKGNERLYRLVYQELLGFEVATENDEVEIEIEAEES